MKKIIIIRANPPAELDSFQNSWIKTELYFGMSIPSGGKVSSTQWKNFVKNNITPVFTQGFSTFKATGRWLDRESNQMVTESSRVLTIFYKEDKAEAKNGLIKDISNKYIQLFQQQAVLRADEVVQAQYGDCINLITESKKVLMASTRM